MKNKEAVKSIKHRQAALDRLKEASAVTRSKLQQMAREIERRCLEELNLTDLPNLGSSNSQFWWDQLESMEVIWKHMENSTTTSSSTHT